MEAKKRQTSSGSLAHTSQKINLEDQSAPSLGCVYGIYGKGREGKGRGGRRKKSIFFKLFCKTLCWVSACELRQFESTLMASSPHCGKGWSYSQPRMPYMSQHLWCSKQHSLCREGLWAQKCLLSSTALQSLAFSTCWVYSDCRSEIRYEISVSPWSSKSISNAPLMMQGQATHFPIPSKHNQLQSLQGKTVKWKEE